MKKVLLTVAIVLAAVVSQAAAIQWKVGAGPNANRLLGQDGNAFKGTAYLILASDAAAFTQQLTNNKTIGSLTTYGSTTAFNATTGATSSTLTSDNTLTATEQSFQVLLLQTIDDKAYYKMSAAMSATPSTDLESNPVLLSWTASTQFNGTAWTQAAAAPEPTSGLLLLLGMAGLALKRKRA